MDSDKQLILEQQEDKATVKKKQNKVLSKLQELQDMQTELRGMITLIEDQKVAAKEKRKSLKDKQSELLALQDELQLQDSELASMQQQVKNKIAQKESEQRSETVVLASHQSSDNNEGSSVVQASKSKSSKKQQTKSAPKPMGMFQQPLMQDMHILEHLINGAEKQQQVLIAPGSFIGLSNKLESQFRAVQPG